MIDYSNVTKIKCNFKTFSIAELKLSKVQRNLDVKHVDEIVKTFDCREVGIISVGKVEGDPNYYVLDGMHRVEAIRRLAIMQGVDLEELELPCVYYRFENWEGFYEKFKKLNNETKKVGPSDMLYAGRHIEGTPSFNFMNLLKRLGISTKDEYYGPIMLGGICKAYNLFDGGKHSEESVEITLKLLKVIAERNSSRNIRGDDVNVILKYVEMGGDIKSTRVQNAIIAAGDALFIHDNKQGAMKMKTRIDYFSTVLNSHLRKQATFF